MPEKCAIADNPRHAWAKWGMQGKIFKCRILKLLFVWCPEPESNRHRGFPPRDFKSLVSTSFTIRAGDSINQRGSMRYDGARIIHTRKLMRESVNFFRICVDTKNFLHIMRTFSSAGIAQLVERYLAKV